MRCCQVSTWTAPRRHRVGPPSPEQGRADSETAHRPDQEQEGRCAIPARSTLTARGPDSTSSPKDFISGRASSACGRKSDCGTGTTAITAKSYGRCPADTLGFDAWEVWCRSMLCDYPAPNCCSETVWPELSLTLRCCSGTRVHGARGGLQSAFGDRRLDVFGAGGLERRAGTETATRQASSGLSDAPRAWHCGPTPST